MNFIFCKLKNLKKHEFHFFASLKTSKNMNFIFCKLKNLKKHEFHFLQAFSLSFTSFCSFMRISFCFFSNFSRADSASEMTDFVSSPSSTMMTCCTSGISDFFNLSARLLLDRLLLDLLEPVDPTLPSWETRSGFSMTRARFTRRTGI